VVSDYPYFHDCHRLVALQIKTLLARVIEQERYDSARKTEKAARMDPEEQAMLAEACRPAPHQYSSFLDLNMYQLCFHHSFVSRAIFRPAPCSLILIAGCRGGSFHMH
jgi:hypothetical protein